MERIRVVVVDDDLIHMDGITLMLERESDMKVEACIPSSDAVLPQIHKIKPHILLLDLGSGQVNNLEIAHSVKREVPSTKIIAIDIQQSERDLYQFVKAGVSGFILHKASIDAFLTTLRSVAVGAAVLPSRLVDALFARLISHEVAQTAASNFINDLKGLTRREQEVTALISDGLTNKEIGNTLNISTFTIKTHIHNILVKLDLESRLQVANHVHSLKETDASGDK